MALQHIALVLVVLAAGSHQAIQDLFYIPAGPIVPRQLFVGPRFNGAILNARTSTKFTTTTSTFTYMWFTTCTRPTLLLCDTANKKLPFAANWARGLLEEETGSISPSQVSNSVEVTPVAKARALDSYVGDDFPFVAPHYFGNLESSLGYRGDPSVLVRQLFARPTTTITFTQSTTFITTSTRTLIPSCTIANTPILFPACP